MNIVIPTQHFQSTDDGQWNRKKKRKAKSSFFSTNSRESRISRVVRHLSSSVMAHYFQFSFLDYVCDFDWVVLLVYSHICISNPGQSRSKSKLLYPIWVRSIYIERERELYNCTTFRSCWTSLTTPWKILVYRYQFTYRPGVESPCAWLFGLSILYSTSSCFFFSFILSSIKLMIRRDVWTRYKQSSRNIQRKKEKQKRATLHIYISPWKTCVMTVFTDWTNCSSPF